MALATENFNRADNTQLVGLTSTTGGLTYATLTGGEGFDTFGAVTGAAAASTSNMGTTFGGSPGLSGSYVEASLTDVTMTFTYTKAGGCGQADDGVGFILRVAPGVPEYFRIGWLQNSNVFRAIDYYSGVGHLAVANVAGTLTVGDTLSVQVSGTTVTLLHNGVAVQTATGIHNTTATKHGFYADAGCTQSFIAKCAFDDWSIDSFSGPVLRPTPQSPIVVAQTVPRASIW